MSNNSSKSSISSALPRPPLEYYLGLEYTFNVIAAEEGGYVIAYPDLPGCFTQAETLEEAFEFAREIRELWIETEYEDGDPIPLPTYPEEYSGKFNLRIPKSLHRKLAKSASADRVSLNQYITALLSQGDAQERIERKLDALAHPDAAMKQVAEDKAAYS